MKIYFSWIVSSKLYGCSNAGKWNGEGWSIVDLSTHAFMVFRSLAISSLIVILSRLTCYINCKILNTTIHKLNVVLKVTNIATQI
jgi:hypothetical protein